MDFVDVLIVLLTPFRVSNQFQINFKQGLVSRSFLLLVIQFMNSCEHRMHLRTRIVYTANSCYTANV